MRGRERTRNYLCMKIMTWEGRKIIPRTFFSHWIAAAMTVSRTFSSKFHHTHKFFHHNSDSDFHLQFYDYFLLLMLEKWLSKHHQQQEREPEYFKLFMMSLSAAMSSYYFHFFFSSSSLVIVHTHHHDLLEIPHLPLAHSWLICIEIEKLSKGSQRNCCIWI